MLRPAVFHDSATKGTPFLLSLPFRLHCRAVLELDDQEGLQVYLRRYQHKVPSHIGPTGALRVPLQDFSPSMNSELQQAMSCLRGNEHVSDHSCPARDLQSNNCNLRASVSTCDRFAGDPGDAFGEEEPPRSPEPEDDQRPALVKDGEQDHCAQSVLLAVPGSPRTTTTPPPGQRGADLAPADDSGAQ